jgi:hypothetical protein
VKPAQVSGTYRNTCAYNITGAWAVDRNFVYIGGPAERVGESLTCLLTSVGVTLALFGAPLGFLGFFGCLWVPLETFGSLLASFETLGAPSGASLAKSGSERDWTDSKGGENTHTS